MAPDLNTPEDVRRYKDLFATSKSGGKAVLVNCIEGWKCKDINRQKVESYGLEEVITLEVPLTADALIKSLEDAYELGEPWLGYLWGPTEIAKELDLTLLEELPMAVLCPRRTATACRTAGQGLLLEPIRRRVVRAHQYCSNTFAARSGESDYLVQGIHPSCRDY